MIPFDITMNAPNAETLATIEEVKAMKRDRSLGKTYTDVDEMFRELLS
jgi:DNA-damage-inducible protein J